VRALDRRAIEEYGIPSLLLMENAGRACAEEALRMAPDPGSAVLVVCGPGNNGGDGLVIARTLHNRARAVRVVFVGARARLEEGGADVRTNLRLWRGLGQDVEVVEEPAAAAALDGPCAAAGLVVDALFGTGLVRPVGEPWASAIRALNAASCPVLAVDLPSGLDADSGAELGVAVRADVTLSFVAAKPGFARARGPALCGRVEVAEIGIPRSWIEAAAAAESRAGTDPGA